MLLSEDFAQPTEGGTTLGVRQAYNLKGQEGYANGVNELNNICSIYGNGKGAIGARSVNVDDVNKITGYNPNNTGVKDPMQTGSGDKCHKGNLYEYGNSVKYTLLSNGVKYDSENGIGSGTGRQLTFSYYDETNKRWRFLNQNESIVAKNTGYIYYPTTLTTTNDKTAKIGVEENSIEYKMLFTNSTTGKDTSNRGTTNKFEYWIADTVTNPATGFIYFEMRRITEARINHVQLYLSDGGANNINHGIRAIVTLNNKAKLTDSGTTKDGCKLYNLIVN